MSLLTLPKRVGVKPRTNPIPPHLQYDQHSPQEIYHSLADWMFNAFPKSREHKTLISVPSSRAMWLDENIKNTPKDGFMPPPKASRDFAHLHKDGSIHVCLPEKDIDTIYDAQWGNLILISTMVLMKFWFMRREINGISRNIERKYFTKMSS